ncbi:MAG: PorT family protein [Bacteroidales bacterium]|nr:PorT family protein [Bacteroidales bacterium]
MKMMNKMLLLGAVSMLTVTSLKAQEITSGIKGGLTLSNLYIDRDELDDENARIGFHAGFFSQIMFAETFGLQPEFLFTTKGTEAKYEGMFDQTVNFNMNYIDIPLFAVLRPVEVLEIYAGPYIGFMLNSNIKYSGALDGEDELDRDHFNTLDYGVAGGVALNFGGVQAGARYYVGLQKLADSDASSMMLGDSKHSYGQLYIAFKL